MFWQYAFIMVAIIIAIVLQSDADLPLLLLSYKPDTAFVGQIVWIAGASSGIGASLAADMVKAGATVIISARRMSQLEDVANICSQYGTRPFVLEMDMTSLESQEKAFNAVIEKFGHIDSLVLNAGQSQRNIAVETSLEVTQQLMNLNFMSYVSLTKLVVPTMIKRHQGQIVVMSSLSGIIGTPVGSSYSASKFALHGYFNAFRAEVASHNISVSIVCPGPVESEIAEKAHRNPNFSNQKEGEKMPTARCTYLIAKGMYHRVEEMWVSDQPFLLMTYFTQYAPYLSRQLATKVLGPARIKLLEEGGNLYDTQAAFGLK